MVVVLHPCRAASPVVSPELTAALTRTAFPGLLCSTSCRSRRGATSKSGAFERVAFLTDGVSAIALTLIVVGVSVPTLQHSGAASSSGRAWATTCPVHSFLIGVLVLVTTASFEQLRAIDRGYVIWTMLYLGAIAFLPYPIRIVGSYSDNPVAWAIFAANLAVVELRGGPLRPWVATPTAPRRAAEGRLR